MKTTCSICGKQLNNWEFMKRQGKICCNNGTGCNLNTGDFVLDDLVSGQCSTATIEGGAHWAPREFSPAIAAIFAEQNRSLYVDGLMYDDISF